MAIVGVSMEDFFAEGWAVRLETTKNLALKVFKEWIYRMSGEILGISQWRKGHVFDMLFYYEQKT